MNKQPTIWHALPEAAALLASLAAIPPRERCVRGTLGPHDGETRFDDERVRELERIHATESRRILAECDEAKDHAAFYAHSAVPFRDVVAAAIEAGLAPVAMRRAA